MINIVLRLLVVYQVPSVVDRDSTPAWRGIQALQVLESCCMCLIWFCAVLMAVWMVNAVRMQHQGG